MGEQDGRDGFAQGIGWTAERGAGLIDVVLQQPRLGERRADGQLVFARDRGRAERLREVFRGPHGVAALERRLRARQDRLKGDADHGRSIHAPRPARRALRDDVRDARLPAG